MKNQSIRVEAPKMNMAITENDNSYIIRGNTEEGYINRTILKNSENCDEKVLSLLDDIYSYQKAELNLFKAVSEINLDLKYNKLIRIIRSEFKNKEE